MVPKSPLAQHYKRVTTKKGLKLECSFADLIIKNVVAKLRSVGLHQSSIDSEDDNCNDKDVRHEV